MKRDQAPCGSTPPDFLTVEEAARVLRIGRTAAYRLARLYLATGGAPGLLPVVRCGKQLRVPRCKLEEMLGGPITWPPAPFEPPGTSAVTPITAPRERTARRRASRSIAHGFKAVDALANTSTPVIPIADRDELGLDAIAVPSVEQLALLPK